MRPEPLPFDLTLLGYGTNVYPLLVEVAADAQKTSPEKLRVQIVHNLPVEQGAWREKAPGHWYAPTYVSLEDWIPSGLDGVLMPGVLREPTVSIVWRLYSEAKGLRPSDLGVLVHSTAHVAPSATLGPGTWVQPNATVASMSHLGMCCHVNRNASVGHHNRWGRFCRINPGAHTAGQCHLGEGVTIGMGAVVREGINVGRGGVVGAGSVVIKHVAEGETVVGIPAKPLQPKVSA
jgi:UDP-3-O-[3-hydroxymyristoyl] glucosamine N-acyltransferase